MFQYEMIIFRNKKIPGQGNPGRVSFSFFSSWQSFVARYQLIIFGLMFNVAIGYALMLLMRRQDGAGDADDD